MNASTAWPKDWNREPEWMRLWQCLLWSYGLDRADRIMSGIDAPSNRDLQAWRGIGRQEPEA